MSRNFSANQYERSFRGERLGNWEVTKWYPHERPRARRGHTKVIADDHGHLLPGVPRVEPWNHFSSTWQLPRRITRKLARDINTIRPAGKHLTSWEKRSYHVPLVEKATQLPPAKKEKRKDSAKKEIPIVNDSSPVEERSRREPNEHDYSVPLGPDRNPKVVDTVERVKQDLQTYHEAIGSAKQVEAVDSPLLRTPDSTTRKTPPLESEFITPLFAKELAQGNLKHQPLPDTVSNEVFKSLQMKKERNPGKNISNSPVAAAVGHKKFVSPGPTQCSKMSVFRPKTAVSRNSLLEPAAERPKTSRIKELGPIDLALCWDITLDRTEEPRKPIHIDGSTDSAGPSVFTLVKPPLSDDDAETNKDKNGSRVRSGVKTAWEMNPSAVMDIVNNNNEVTGKIGRRNEEFNTSVVSGGSAKSIKSGSGSAGKRSVGSGRICSGSKGCGSEENQNPNIPRKSSGKGSLESSIDSEKLSRTRHYRSSPNLSSPEPEHNCKSKRGGLMMSRPCMACETKGLTEEKKVKSDYKMAFKAGVPQTGGSPRNSSGNSAKISVPKPKTPFAKRSYSINTLAPPFSLWPGTTGMDYPEHWRLASVYQHSFKPIELRKKPLLQGVFH